MVPFLAASFSLFSRSLISFLSRTLFCHSRVSSSSLSFCGALADDTDGFSASLCLRRSSTRFFHSGSPLATAAVLGGTLPDPDSFLRSNSCLFHSGISASAVFADRASLPTATEGFFSSLDGRLSSLFANKASLPTATVGFFSSLEGRLSSLFAIRVSLPTGTEGFSFSLEARRSSIFAARASLFTAGTGGLCSLEARCSSLFGKTASSGGTGDISLSLEARRSSSLFFHSGILPVSFLAGPSSFGCSLATVFSSVFMSFSTSDAFSPSATDTSTVGMSGEVVGSTIGTFTVGGTDFSASTLSTAFTTDWTNSSSPFSVASFTGSGSASSSFSASGGGDFCFSATTSISGAAAEMSLEETPSSKGTSFGGVTVLVGSCGSVSFSGGNSLLVFCGLVTFSGVCSLVRSCGLASVSGDGSGVVFFFLISSFFHSGMVASFATLLSAVTSFFFSFSFTALCSCSCFLHSGIPPSTRAGLTDERPAGDTARRLTNGDFPFTSAAFTPAEPSASFLRAF